MLKIIAATLLILLIGSTIPSSYADAVEINSSQIPLIPGQHPITNFGDLVYQGGLILESTDKNFGGFSALDISADRTHLIAFSDQGYRLEADLTYDSLGKLNNLVNARLDPIWGTKGTPLKKKSMNDAEAMARLPNGALVVAFERNHRLLLYKPDKKIPTNFSGPDNLSDAPYNEGIEALTTLIDGRLLALTQGLGDSKTRTGWIGREHLWTIVRYPYQDGFEPSGATTLPSGDVIVLERRYSYITGLAIRLRHIPQSTITSGAMLNGAIIGEFAPPQNIDNMEGIASAPGQDGNVLLYVISDDNFNKDDQRTLLLVFSLEGDFK